MPRLGRLDAPGVLHHVMGRGIEKRKIFLGDEDRNDFIDRLSALVQKGAIEIYAWVLMPNHFHILCKSKNLPLASSMRKLLTGYVVNYNKRHRRYGHLFQNRYKSIVCQEDAYLKELVRYIHLNLLRAGLVNDLKELDRNPWSGHSALVGKIKREWQNTEYVLSYFGGTRNAKKNYSQYINEGIDQGRRAELVGGGLIRSMGGWSAVLASRRRGGREIADQRILGDGDFVKTVISGLDDLVKKNLRLSGQRIDIKALAEKISERYNISIGELLSGSRRREVVKARCAISLIGVRELGYSGADVARYLGVTNSCVTRLISAGGKQDINDMDLEL
ncbi:MAG: transposase [Desulfobacteraceae bacterium]|nr:MAG: transposase [Desulfobacteraceae bacterium]